MYPPALNAVEQDTTMKQITVSVIALFTAIAPAVALAQSVPDANPECMERNGPDCVLQGQVVTRRAAPPAEIVPPGVVVVPPVTPSVVVAPSGTLPPRGTVPSSGLVGSPEAVVPAPASPAANISGSTNVIVPSGQGSTIISPCK